MIEIVIKPGAKDGSNDGVGVGISASNLEKSRAFYREFVGLDELPAVKDKVLGLTLYPYRRGETMLYLYHAGENLPADNGSAGIQYVVSDTPMAAAKGAARNIPIETPLNKLRGFDLVTIWLNDPDGVTNYYAQIARRPRNGGGELRQGLFTQGRTGSPARLTDMGSETGDIRTCASRSS